jgi:transcriptional regulator with XRE-family HTH domain
MGLAEMYGVNLDEVIRFQVVKRRCVDARAAEGLGLRDAAKRLGVPQYRIRDIESGSIQNVSPPILHRYLEMLGLTAWYEKWSQANPELADRLRG